MSSQYTPSLAISVQSITASEVSQVDFKMKANNVKNKLKVLLKSVDNDKSGFVKYEIFFPMLELHGVMLSSKAVNYLKQTYSKNQTINFKEAVNQLTIDLQVAAGTDSDARDGSMKWTVLALTKKTTLDEKSVS